MIFSLMSTLDHHANADTDQQIPPWFRDNASLWLSGNMNDQQFMQAIHQLVTNISYSQDRQVNQTT
ncbi:MAG: hypothetical protein ACREBB_02085, partial [Nitrosotalea sp.]